MKNFLYSAVYKVLFIVVGFLLFVTEGICQVSTFSLPCNQGISVAYSKKATYTTLVFQWTNSYSLSLTKDLSDQIKKNKAADLTATVITLLSEKSGTLTLKENIKKVALSPDSTIINVDYGMRYTLSNIVSVNNPAVTEKLYNELKLSGVLPCATQAIFADSLLAGIQKLDKELALADPAEFADPVMVRVDSPRPEIKNNPYYDYDNRNPITFTEFIVRNPRVNGQEILDKIGNYGSYHYIRPGTIINLLFNYEIYKKLNNVKLKIQAYIKRKDESIVPISVSGYYIVKLETNEKNFEKLPVAAQTEGSVSPLTYKYEIESTAYPPIQAEINTSSANPQVGDRLIVTVTNVGDGNVGFTTTMEYDDFGWSSQPSASFSWVNTINMGSNNFLPAGTSGFNFTYKLNKGANFWANFFTPSFGPELSVLQDGNQNTWIGLGGSVSEFMRTVKIGYGWFLSGNNGRPYISIGVNFIEGYQTISSILGRSQPGSAKP